MSKKGLMSTRQYLIATMCRVLAGNKMEENIPERHLLPDEVCIHGLRLGLWRIFSKLRYKEGLRLARKYGTHVFKAHPADRSKSYYSPKEESDEKGK